MKWLDWKFSSSIYSDASKIRLKHKEGLDRILLKQVRDYELWEITISKLVEDDLDMDSAKTKGDLTDALIYIGKDWQANFESPNAGNTSLSRDLRVRI